MQFQNSPRTTNAVIKGSIQVNII